MESVVKRSTSAFSVANRKRQSRGVRIINVDRGLQRRLSFTHRVGTTMDNAHRYDVPKSSLDLEDDIKTLLPPPEWSITLAKSHVYPKYQLTVPAKVKSLFPRQDVETAMVFHTAKWTVMYRGSLVKRYFKPAEWGRVLEDLRLNKGDKLRFQVLNHQDPDKISLVLSCPEHYKE